MNIDNCSLKDECQFVKELKNKISDMQESYETDAEAKFYDYLGKHESKLEKENQLLKKQFENCKKLKNSLLVRNAGLMYNEKQFIKYLEDEIQSCEAVSDLLFNSNKEMKVYKEILQKYKEIVNRIEQN